MTQETPRPIVCPHGMDMTLTRTAGWSGDIYSYKITQPVCPLCHNSLVENVVRRFVEIALSVRDSRAGR